MKRDPVALAWIVGLGLAALAYVVGPQDFLFRVTDWLHFAAFRLGEVIGDLSLAARDIVRALAIGLYATFVLLSILVIRRGGRAVAMLVWVTILFALLIGRAEMVTESNARWILALALVAVGAATMSHRLRRVTLAPPY